MGVKLLVAGDTVYVFDDDDPIIEIQALVCIGAKLEATSFRVTDERWAAVVPQVEAMDHVLLIDCRKAVVGL